MIQKHTFGGHVYRVCDQKTIRTPDLGECDFGKRIISIPLDGDTKDDLDTIIHESLHASLPFLTENMIVIVAKAVTSLLWRLKWRKLDELEV